MSLLPHLAQQSNPPRPDGQPHPKRLKKTCDYCTSSKVKCDRGRPACSRCIENEAVCHYSETRRVGRPRRMREQQPQQSNQHQEQRPMPMSRTATSSSMEGLAYFPTTIEDAHLFDCMLSPDTPLDTELMGDIDLENLSADFSELTRGRRANSSLHDYFTETDGSTTASSMSSRLHSSAPTYDHSPASILPQQHQQHARGESCIKQALSTLESLSTFACHRAEDFKSSMPSVVGLDGVLQANRAAMSVVQDIMDCTSCAANASVVLMLALVMQQGMDVLWGILNSRYGEDESVEGAEFDLPLAMGGYTLTGDARSRLIKQIVQDEMLEMAKVLEGIQRCGAGAEDEHLGRSRDGLVKSVRARMDEAKKLL